MRRPGTTAAVAVSVSCALLAGCSSSTEPTAGHARSAKPSASTSTTTTTSPASTTPTPTQAPVSLLQARREWNGALRAMAEDQTARYSWGAWVPDEDDPIVSESGVFGLDPMRLAFERTIRDPTAQEDGEPGEYTLRMRRREDQAYMQMADWGPWEGCWLHVTSDMVSEAIGLDLADSPALPVSVAVTLDATVTKPTAQEWFGDPYTEYTGGVPAIEAIQFLGVSAKVLLADQERLSQVRVPIVVAMLTGRVKGAAARGPDVVAALRRADVRIDRSLRRYLSGVTASVAFSNLGKGAFVRLPDSRRVLPDGATKSRTCPAKTPES